MRIRHFIAPALIAVAATALVTGCGWFGGSSPAPAPSPAADAADQGVVVNPSGPAAPSGPSTPGGVAPTPRMLAIDRSALLRASAAGKNIVAQAQKLQADARAEFAGETSRLQADARAFGQQSAILAANVKAQRQHDLEARQQALEQKMQIRGAQIQMGMNQAAEQVAHALEPILRQIMKERQADILVDKQAIVLSTRDDMDITREAISRLDKAIQTVQVKLPTAAEVQAAAAGGGGPQQGAPAPAPAP